MSPSRPSTSRNPTILATLAVIAAILPMAFVSGIMGPYMRPIPIGATAAMIFSIIVAFVVTPWAAIRLLSATGPRHCAVEDRFTIFYRRAMNKLIHCPAYRYGFLGMVVVLLLGSMALVYVQFVKVKMLPFDNKSEFQVIIDMPEGTSLEETEHVARRLAQAAFAEPEVVNVQTYTGTASPYNFNGLVRHYFLRRGSNMADIQVNLLSKHERNRASHDIAKAVRVRLLPIARETNARIKVAEVPPGPPVLQTLVAEVYGPTAEGRDKLAREVLNIFDTTDGVVDADMYLEDPQEKLVWHVDREKAALNGIATSDVAQTLTAASAGMSAGLLHVDQSKEDIPIVVRLDRATRSDASRLASLKVMGRGGNLVPLSELIRIEKTTADKSIYHKNLMPVSYVTADVAGIMESPVYAILDLGPKISKLKVDGGYEVEQYTAAQPFDDAKYAMKWDGEWHITYEVFRDLGIAFAAVLVLIYALVVGWFASFKTPLVIMSAIPFSLVGILPAHWLGNVFFTATSMIGFIAGAGIVVRNSIILVDQIDQNIAAGMERSEAIIGAAVSRFRPIMLTALTAVLALIPISRGIFWGPLAYSMMGGILVATVLTVLVLPAGYSLFFGREPKRKAADPREEEADAGDALGGPAALAAE